MGEVKITDVEFLTPARISIEEDGTAFVKEVNVDLANRRIYDHINHRFIWEDQVFQFLDSSNPLPSDFFSASDDVSDRVQEAYDQARDVQSQHVGEQK